jgi:YidC/Oxa1 family membrane protein insertase
MGMAIFFLISSFRQQQAMRELQERKKLEDISDTKTKRVEQAKVLAEKFASENPDVALPEQAPRKRWTLGTMDAADGYRFLVTLDNLGGTIERIELVEQSEPGRFAYRSLQTKNIGGYLGYLAPEDRSGGGVVVHSVPRGSAAALASAQGGDGTDGIQPGDVVVSWEGLVGPATVYQLEKTLTKAKPGDELRLEIERQGDGAKRQAVLAKLTEQPVAVLRSEDDFPIESVVGNSPRGSCGLTFAKIDSKEIAEGDRSILGLESTLNGTWEASEIPVQGGMGVEFRLPVGTQLKFAGIDANLELVKQYRLLKGPESGSAATADQWQYHLELTTIVRNLDDKPHEVALRQEGLNGIALEGWWYPTKISPYFLSAPGARDVIFGSQDKEYSISMTRTLVDHAKKFPTEPDSPLFGPQDAPLKRNIKYIGLDTQVFAAAMQASPSHPESMNDLNKAKAMVLNDQFLDPAKFDAARQQAYNTGFWFVTPTKTIAPKAEQLSAYRIFAGPKSPELLAAYQLDEAIEYGWDIFGFFAVRLGWILHFFYYIVGNYGLAIMMLTVLVRSCMFPVSRKMAINAQKMQSVQPEMAKLKEALKEEPTKLMTAQQMLMKKAGINQLAGCLPAMIQLPIVIGLYRCVSVDVALRQQPLIPGLEWCSNLAGPDMFLDWQQWMPQFISGKGPGWFGPYLNILPLITITLFIIQQKVLMPKATDEQTRTAQQMMMFMTIMMGVLFFRVPAGLCIYFITSSTWSLIERFLIKKYTPQAEIKSLPEGTVNEILSAVANAGPGQRPSLPSAPKADKPKLKNTKPPETFAELFEPFFKRTKQPSESKESQSNPGSSSSARPERARPNRNPQGKKKTK